MELAGTVALESNGSPQGITRHETELSAGTIEYEDSGGEGPVIVLLHGLLMDASLYDGVIADLSADYRCVAPTLPLGAHRHPMRADADLSLRGIARPRRGFCERLDLRDVTLVGNDTGGALAQLLIGDEAVDMDRIVLVSCDAFDNYPPGLTGQALVLTGKLSPALFGLFMQQMRLRPLRRLPIAFGWLTKHGDAATARWMKPILQQPEIRRDTVHVLRAVSAEPDLMLKAAECLQPTGPPPSSSGHGRTRHAPEHGRRLAERLLPHGRLVEVSDSYTLIPQDQPARLARIIREFMREPGISRALVGASRVTASGRGDAVKAVIIHATGDADVLLLEEVERPGQGRGRGADQGAGRSGRPVDWKYRRGLVQRELPAVLGEDVSGTVAVSRAVGFAPETGFSESRRAAAAAVRHRLRDGDRHQARGAEPRAGGGAPHFQG